MLLKQGFCALLFRFLYSELVDPPFSLQVQSLLYGLKVSHMGLLDSVALSGAVQLLQKMQAKKCGNKRCVGLSLLFL